ncbi:uncharacterized protein [Physcomitrium patens]|jgi:hypothetical protein|nr:uncharacterized protein LOC112273402 [Physcomitrium patens]XP_024358212.1 uncharacterized protein LOC112273540 [Physcomitrium patens]PNR33252.1 hypothetical protein PHYPA_025195 [Physcomitrium patens]PNR33253.1 hypothetical protein PHYPA_025196 [Physcomitrium patens]|eukprot:XP_024357897.1 uncharacterized protein LOC112273402 [Physcomitrella patens]
MKKTTCFKLLLVIAALVVTTLPAAVEAVDIQGFDNSAACTGTGYTFPGIAQRTCAAFTNEGSILIRDLSSCQTGRAYRNGGCTTEVGNGNGPTVWCFVGGSYTGAAWFNNCRRRRLQADNSHESCTSTSAPNGVHYTEHLSKGSWILHSDNATELMAELKKIVDEEKVNWLKARGAYLIPGSDTIEYV